MKALTPLLSSSSLQHTQPILRDVKPVAQSLAWVRRRSSWVCQRCLYTGQASSTPRQRYHDKSWIVYRKRSLETNSSSLLSARRALSSSRHVLRNQSRNASEELKELPSEQEGRRSHLSRRFSDLMDHVQSNVFIAGQRLNDLTGYSGIEALKKDIERQG